MKNYLNEPLTKDEKNYIFSIIQNTSLRFMKETYKISQNESLCLYDEEQNEKILSKQFNYEFINEILENKILKDISELKSYSLYEKEKIVETLESIAHELNIEKFITPLNFNEKLVVFLLYMEKYQINEISVLLNISRTTIWRIDKSIKNKIINTKEALENGKSFIQ